MSPSPTNTAIAAVAKVQRYTLDPDTQLSYQPSLPFIREDADGEYVLHADYLLALAKLAEVEKERDQYRDRLQIDPGGSDKIDELQTACDMLRAQNADMRAELDEARKIVGGEAYDLAHLAPKETT